jgi:hypothetical protein
MIPLDASTKHLSDLNQEAEKLTKKHNYYSVIRLSLFLLSVFTIYLFVVGYSIIIPLIVVTGFILSLIEDSRLSGRLKVKQALKALNEDEIKSDKAHTHRIFGNGSQYIDPKHPYSFDIDVFGEGSLFKAINRTVTPSGDARLSQTLRIINKNNKEIKARQSAIEELSNSTDLRHSFMVEKYLHPKVPKDNISELVNSEELNTIDSERISYRLLIIILPLLFILSVFMASSGIVSANIPVVFFVLQLFVVGRFVKRINTYHRMIDIVSKNLKRDSRLLKNIEKHTFHSELLSELKRELIEKEDSERL